MHSDQRVLGRIWRHATAIAAVLCLLFAGRIAVDGQPPEVVPVAPLTKEDAAAAAALVTGRNDAQQAEVMPQKPLSKEDAAAAVTGVAYSSPSEPAPSTPDATAQKDEAYGTSPSSDEASPATDAQPAPSSDEAAPATDQTETQTSPSPSPSSDPTDGLNTKAINDIVKEHNVFRARERVPPIK